MAVSMSASLSVYTAYNDSHRNVRKYQIDSQALENASHFAMRITLFSSLVQGNLSVVLMWVSEQLYHKVSTSRMERSDCEGILD